MERRWRLAALLGLVALLLLAAFAVVMVAMTADANRTVGVLRATKDIHAGNAITADELGVTYIRAQDPSVLSSLVLDSQRTQLVGQPAAEDVAAGQLVPAGIASQQAASAMWEANVPVRRMPADLRPGDHVALVVTATDKSGQPVEYVLMQDVRVLGVQSGAVDIWLPPKVVAQVQWFADHGGIVLVKMPAGGVQQNLPGGGGS